MRDGDGEGAGWIINGAKIFISGADRADYGIVFARTDPARGRAGVTCFIVETEWPRIPCAPRRAHPSLRELRDRAPVRRTSGCRRRTCSGRWGGGFAIANDRLSRQRIPYAAACIGVAIAGAGDGHRVRAPAGDLRGASQQPASRCRT